MNHFYLIFGFAIAAISLSAQELSLLPGQDNTLYQSASGSVSNGQGPHIYVGQTAQDDSRRALLAFDLSGVTPGTPVQDATLELSLNLEPTSASGTPISLHRVTQPWGEGTSSTGNAPGGAGVAATPGDATWVHNFFNSSTWTRPGGDFNPAPSATTTVDDPGTYTWTGSAFAADVQSWIDDPNANNGLILLGNETTTRNARRFDSREGSNPPTLRINFAAVPEPGTLGLLVLGAGLILLFRRRMKSED